MYILEPASCFNASKTYFRASPRAVCLQKDNNTDLPSVSMIANYSRKAVISMDRGDSHVKSQTPNCGTKKPKWVSIPFDMHA